MANRIVSIPLACSAYLPGQLGPGSTITPRTHAAEVDEDGEPVRVLCRVKLHNVLPDSSQYDLDPVDCPTCARRWAKLKAAA